MSVPDFCDALTAYRAWQVHQNGVLCGQAHSEPWPPYQPMVARCAQLAAGTAHLDDQDAWIPVPAYQCGCGLHALKSREAAEARRQVSGGWTYTPSAVVWGAVKIWGRIIEHTDGYRAAFAYPSELWCDDAVLAARVATLYGVPCHVQARAPEETFSLDHFTTLQPIYFPQTQTYVTSTDSTYATQYLYQQLQPQTPQDARAQANQRKKQQQIDQRTYLAQRFGSWNP